MLSPCTNIDILETSLVIEGATLVVFALDICAIALEISNVVPTILSMEHLLRIVAKPTLGIAPLSQLNFFRE